MLIFTSLEVSDVGKVDKIPIKTEAEAKKAYRKINASWLKKTSPYISLGNTPAPRMSINPTANTVIILMQILSKVFIQPSPLRGSSQSPHHQAAYREQA